MEQKEIKSVKSVPSFRINMKNVTGSFAKWYLEPKLNCIRLKNICANLHGCMARLKGLDMLYDYTDDRMLQIGVWDQPGHMDMRQRTRWY